jgi:hypothetical protein
MSVTALPEEWISPSEVLDEEVTLLGVDSNMGSIMSYVTGKLKKAGNSREVIDGYRLAIFGGDYHEGLSLSMRYLGMIDDDE